MGVSIPLKGTLAVAGLQSISFPLHSNPLSKGNHLTVTKAMGTSQGDHMEWRAECLDPQPLHRKGNFRQVLLLEPFSVELDLPQFSRLCNG